MNIVCLDGFFFKESHSFWDEVRKLGNFTYYETTSKEDTIKRAKDAHIIFTNKVIIGKEEIDQLPNLKFISVLATGYNVVDIEYAKSKNILVANVPKYSTKSVAQHTFAMILDICNGINKHSEHIKNDGWINSSTFSYNLQPIIDLNEKTIGIIGFGEIGREVAKIAIAFNMNVLSLKRGRPYENHPNVEFVSLNELLSRSDIISIHCPANKETIGMVNSEFLSKMKKSAILLNLARGVIVNEEDVKNALNNDIIAHYGADVICNEPMTPDCPLHFAKNITLTPHNAWASEDSLERLIKITIDNTKGFLKRKPINIVN